MRPRSFAIFAAVVAVASFSPRARGGSFDAQGNFSFDPNAVVTMDFEQAGSGGAGGAGALTTKADPVSLSGSHLLALSPQQGASVPVALPGGRRSYKMAVWAKDGEAVVDLELHYVDTNPSEVATLYPTGRVTSDGWVELGNANLRVDGDRLKAANVSFFAANGGSIDALEIVPDGDASVFPAAANATCHGATDGSSCAADQICMWSECRNVRGWVPPVPENKDQVADYLIARAQLLFGPYLERQMDLPNSLVSWDQMRDAKDAWSFWNGFMLGVRRLHDGHTGTSGIAGFVLTNPRPLNLCFLEGDGDLTDATAPKDPDYLDVLVSHVGADHNLGLNRGDRLVAVDHMHPIAWARQLVLDNWDQPSISNHRTYAELASDLRRTISRFASTIDVIRCDAASTTCGDAETISIDDLPQGPPDTTSDFVDCDNRPLRHLSTSPADHATGESVYTGLVDEADPSEKIYGMEWESMYSSSASDGVVPAITQAVSTFKTSARGVILDHRTGTGGTEFAPDVLWSFKVHKRPGFYFYERAFAEEEQPTVAHGLDIFTAASMLGLTNDVGGASPDDSLPVAILLTEDVSFSDIWPFGMKGATNVRIFAPFETNGAFSTRFPFGYWLGLNYVMAVGDTFDPQGNTHNGTGVSPDEIVLPLQSDLVAGKDTLFEAALAWVRQGATP